MSAKPVDDGSMQAKRVAALDLNVAHLILDFIDNPGTFRALALTCREASLAARSVQKKSKKRFARPSRQIAL